MYTGKNQFNHQLVLQVRDLGLLSLTIHFQTNTSCLSKTCKGYMHRYRCLNQFIEIMTLTNKLSILAFFLASFTLVSCGDDDNAEVKNPGSFSILFDNMVDGKQISLQDAGNQTFDFTDANGQDFNISKMRYYISKVELEGPDGVKHIDPLNVSPNADEVTGYYLIEESNSSSRVINLSGVEAGVYNKIRFTVGIDEDGVEEGASGGILDPAEGAWFWNWNAGYISFAIEGNAANSGQEYVDWGNGFETLEGTYALHVGGWKDVEPAPGENPVFVNNIKVIELDFGSDVRVEEGLNPEAHITVDAMKALEGIDFETQFAVHRPDLGSPFADNLKETFVLDHVHQ